MRLILTLTAVILFNSEAIAKSFSPEVQNNLSIIELDTFPSKILPPKSNAEINVAILYKMKENIIRRELSFIPKKKWMKWS